jgi:hypothetical protein
MSEIIYSVLFIILTILLLVTIYYSCNNKKESFTNFSPYYGNIEKVRGKDEGDYNDNKFPSVYQKDNDYKLLQKTLEKWEKPFNNNDEGYRNAESPAGPPLVPIYSYTPMKHL